FPYTTLFRSGPAHRRAPRRTSPERPSRPPETERPISRLPGTRRRACDPCSSSLPPRQDFTPPTASPVRPLFQPKHQPPHRPFELHLIGCDRPYDVARDHLATADRRAVDQRDRMIVGIGDAAEAQVRP